MVVLRPKDTREVLDLLARDPLESVFLHGLILRTGVVLDDRRGRFLGFRGTGRELHGVLLLSPLVVPYATTAEAASAFGYEVARSRVSIRNIVGRRETVMRLWEGMGPDRPSPRLVRDRQPVFRVTASELRPQGTAAIRRATLDDLGLVVAAGAAMMSEEVEENPLEDRPAEYHRFIRDRIVRGDEYVWTGSDGLYFKCNVSSRTPAVAQVEGVYTPPALRRRGYAARGLSALCRRLLAEVPMLCLYVNDFNRPAIRLYERLGFQREFDYQSIFFPPHRR